MFSKIGEYIMKSIDPLGCTFSHNCTQRRGESYDDFVIRADAEANAYFKKHKIV